MPHDPSYIDPFYKPRKASRLERLRYRFYVWAEEHEDPYYDSRLFTLKARRRLLAVALAMAGCGAVVAAWVVFGWGGG